MSGSRRNEWAGVVLVFLVTIISWKSGAYLMERSCYSQKMAEREMRSIQSAMEASRFSGTLRYLRGEGNVPWVIEDLESYVDDKIEMGEWVFQTPISRPIGKIAERYRSKLMKYRQDYPRDFSETPVKGERINRIIGIGRGNQEGT